MSKTLFEKIIAREIPATIVYEDNLVFAIREHRIARPKRPCRIIGRTSTARRRKAAIRRTGGRPWCGRTEGAQWSRD